LVKENDVIERGKYRETKGLMNGCARRALEDSKVKEGR
jgi:hypothetical protein